MEGLLAIAAIIIFVVRAVKASESKQKNQNDNQTEPQRPVATPRDPFEQFRRLEEIKRQQNKTFEGVNRPNAEGYGQEKLEKDGYRQKQEKTVNFVSSEGSESSEGKCIEPNANHCAVEHTEDSVYASEIGMEESNCFTHEDVVKGIIMAEILSKPKSLQ